MSDLDNSQDPPVLTERRESVLLITLNRPDMRNAVNLPLAQGIAAALDELDGEASLSVGVLTGAGKGFCAGMDLKAFVTGERPWVGDRGFAGIVRRASVKPLIAAIEGFAVAGGLEVALACDLIVASRGAKLGIPEVKRSLVAAGGALLRLPRSLALQRRHGAGLDRRSDPRRARLRAWLGQSPGRAWRRGRDGLGLGGRDLPSTRLSLWLPPSASCKSSGTGLPRRCGRPRAPSPTLSSLRRTPARVPLLSLRSARRSGAAVNPEKARRGLAE